MSIVEYKPTPAPRHFWVVSTIKRFDELELAGGIPFRATLRTDEEPYWFLPCFETREAAERWNAEWGTGGTIYEVAETAPQSAEPAEVES